MKVLERSPGRDLQVRRARRAHRDPPVRRLRRPARALRVPELDPGAGRGDRRPRPQPSQREPKAPVDEIRAARDEIAARKAELERTRIQLEAREADLEAARAAQGRRRSTRSRQTSSGSRATFGDIEDDIARPAPGRAGGATGDAHRCPPARSRASSSSGFIWPVNGPVVSPFGLRWGRMHEGIDIAVPAGTPIRAVADGSVALASPRPRAAATATSPASTTAAGSRAATPTSRR